MDAWEYDDIEADRAAGGRLYHEFLRVPDLSAGIYVLEAGATDPQSPHTEDELYYVVAGRGAGHGRRRRRGRSCPVRWSSSRPASRTASTTSPSASSCSSCSDPPRATAPDCPRPSATASPAVSRKRQRQLGATAGLVVAEEHEHVVARRQERLEPRGPGRELGLVVVVASQPEVQERPGPAQGRRLARPRAARSRTGRHRRPPAPRTSRRRATTGPGTPSSGAGRPATRRASRPASRRRAGRPRGRGTGRSRAAPRTPGTDRSAMARAAAGSAWSARNEPPRWALTANRKSAGVAPTQAATLAADGEA